MLIETETDLEKALQWLESQDVIAFDTESTGLNVRKDTVIGIGVSNLFAGFYLPRFVFVPGSGLRSYSGISDDLARKLLEALRAKKLITWNASFDCRITRNNVKVDVLPALHCDVLLLKHTCDEEFPFGLKDVAANVFGAHVKSEQTDLFESIKRNGGAKTEYYKADVAVLAKYCVQDCILTYRLYEHYSKILVKEKLEQFFYVDEVMPLYKEVTIPMEDRGVRMDVPAMQAALSTIATDLSTLEAAIQAAIAPHLASIFLPWRMNLDYPIKTYTGRVPKWFEKARAKNPVATDLELQLAQHHADTDGAYPFNLLSKYDLKKLFFDTLGCKALSTTPKGSPQVDEAFLESIVPQYPWVGDLIVYNKLTKLKGTYIERFLNECEGDIFYPSWFQHRTVSGRYGGDLQQLPRPLESGHPLVVKYTNLIRTFVIPRNGNLLLSDDYNQLEPTVFAHTSGDRNLQAIFTSGLDFYSEVAIRTEGLSQFSSDKTAPNYLGKLAKSLRQKAKAYALGIAYGLTPYKLQFELGVPIEEAERLHKQYLDAFPQLRERMYKSQDTARLYGKVQVQTGRIRHLPNAKRLHEKYGSSLSDSLHLWKAYHGNPAVYEAAKRDRKIYINELNNAINVQVQGLAASIVNRAAIACARAGYLPIANIHDELLFDLPVDQIENASTTIRHLMENTTKLSVPLVAPPQTGTDYSKCK